MAEINRIPLHPLNNLQVKLKSCVDLFQYDFFWEEIFFSETFFNCSKEKIYIIFVLGPFLI